MPTAFYDYRKLYSLNAVFNCVIGARGVGKTYGAKRDAINRGVKYGEEFIYLRRYDEELKDAKKTFFDDVMGEFPEWDFRVSGSFAECCHVSSRAEKKREWLRIGHFAALSRAQAVKSVSYTRVRRIIFDEFIAELGVQYLPKEARAFQGFYNTVDRYREKVRVFMLANAVSIANPYFVHWKIRVPENTEISRYNDGFLAVHFPRADDFAAEVAATRFGRFLLEVDPEHANYAIGNQFADNHKALVKAKDSTAVYRFTLLTLAGNIALWYSSVTRQWYAVDRRVPAAHENVFTTEPNFMREGVTLLGMSDPLMARLRTAWRKGRVYFDSPNTRAAYLETFK